MKIEDYNCEEFIKATILGRSKIENISLCHGKAGHAIMLYEFGKKRKSKYVFSEASNFSSDVVNNLEGATSIDFEYGLSGIGWAIEYLYHRGFLTKPDLAKITYFEDTIFRHILNAPFENIGLFDGWTGVAFFFQIRLCRHIKDRNRAGMLIGEIAIEHILRQIALCLARKNNFDVPLNFDLKWGLPWLIILLSKIIQTTKNRSKNLTDLISKISILLKNSKISTPSYSLYFLLFSLYEITKNMLKYKRRINSKHYSAYINLREQVLNTCTQIEFDRIKFYKAISRESDIALARLILIELNKRSYVEKFLDQANWIKNDSVYFKMKIAPIKAVIECIENSKYSILNSKLSFGVCSMGSRLFSDGVS